MNEDIVRADAKPFPLRATLPWLAGTSIYGLLLVLGERLLNDPDTYWQIATGRWIAAHGAVPRVDPFSFTMHGAPWVAFEWLSELIYAGAFALSGWAGVVIVAALATALAFGLLTRYLLRTLAPTPALILVLAALSLAAPHMLARPHVLALPVMIAWAAAIVGTMDRGSAPPYAALPLLTLWANLHGSVIVGLALIGPAVLEALVQADNRGRWPHIVLRWLPFGALALLAACITPYGPDSLLMPLKTLGLGDALNTIAEWRPQDFGHFSAFEAALLLAIFALSRGIALPPLRVLLVLGLLHLALTHTRNTDLLAVLAPLYLAKPLAPRFGRAADERSAGLQMPTHRIWVAAVATALVATALAALRPVAPPARNTPAAAVAATSLAEAGPVLNSYDFGGYLIYKGIAPFIDGRGEVYGAKFIAQYNRAVSLADLPGFLALLDHYHIRATLLAPDTPAVALLDRLPAWKRVYTDAIAVVHERRDGTSTR